jgi:acetylornithine/succinyldiaminopimelate/putrescine aminotransferase/predicted amino acid dehydrogenase
MSPTEILDYLRGQGVELWLDAEQLRYRAPKGLMTADLRSLLSEKKSEIVAVLRRKVDDGADNGKSSTADTSGKTSPPERAGIRSRPFSVDPAMLLESHPYIRYVNPYTGFILSQLDLDKQFVRGEGCYLYDDRGERYLDFIAQYGAVPFGYNPPDIWNALLDLRETQVPSLVQPSALTVAGELAERLIETAPPGLRYVTFASTGAEAIEVAIKICWAATGRRGILSTENSFHGKTLGALSATGRRVYQEAFGPPAPGFSHIPFGDVDALENALNEKKDYYAAFIVEPVQGEGGIITAPEGYLRRVSEICRREKVLLVVDEVQTGLGRTGKLFACEHEGVTPDVMTLAKALGGGLMPIGACLCTEAAYTREFALSHSSTFAGNALACQAGIATLELLKKDDQFIVRQVAENGMHLKSEILRLQNQYPSVIKSVRGIGYLLGIQFDLDSSYCSQGWLGYLADQEVFNYVLTSYLLNVEKVRVAPTANAGDVLRIEPPLVAGKRECDAFVEALERVLKLLSQGETARLVAHLAGLENGSSVPTGQPGKTVRSKPSQPRRRVSAGTTSERDGRFAFLTYVNAVPGYVDIDPNFNTFTPQQMSQLRKRVRGLLNPATIGETIIESRTGQRAYGEFIALPYSVEELVDLPYEQALEEIIWAVTLAKNRGARIVGLGGFTSVVTQAGLSLRDAGLSPLTTGNSYTAIAGKRTVELICADQGKKLAQCAVAVVGAAGSVGRATTLLVAEDVERLILIGNPNFPERSRKNLLQVARGTVEHLWKLHRSRHVFTQGTLGAAVASQSLPDVESPEVQLISLVHQFIRDGRITLTTDIHECLRNADVVITATSSVETFVTAEDLKRDAIVCELSRPFNVCEDVGKSRPDVSITEGGLIRVPGELDMGFDIGLGPGVVYACVAETMLLALEHCYQDTSLGVDLEISALRRIEAMAEKHGFSVEYSPIAYEDTEARK